MKNFYFISLFLVSSLSALCQVNTCETQYLCDGNDIIGNANYPNDCPDGSDELLAYCCVNATQYSAYSSNSYGISACADYMSLINTCGTQDSYICDGNDIIGNADYPNDCPDGSDEITSHCCINADSYVAYSVNSIGIAFCEAYFNGTVSGGCTDSLACNYDPVAVIDNGTCEYTSCTGCMNSDACNYDPLAIIDDGSCAVNDDCGVCDGDNSSCGGCTDPSACNYDPIVIVDDGSCAVNDDCGVCDGDNSSCGGCTDPNAINYDPFIIVDDGSCVYGESLLVTNTNDSGPGSFREIVVNANDGAVIRFHQDLLGQTINLNTADYFEINSSITITGIIEGEDHVTINLIQDQTQSFIQCNNSLTIDSLRFTNENEPSTYSPVFWLNSPSAAEYSINILNTTFENFDSSIFGYIDMNVTGFDPNSKLFVDNCKFLNNTALVVIPGNDGADNVLDSVFVHNTTFDSNSAVEFNLGSENGCYFELVDANVVGGGIPGSVNAHRFDIFASSVFLNNVNLDQNLNINGSDSGYSDIVLQDISIQLPSNYDMSFTGWVSASSVSITSCDFVSNMEQEDISPFNIRGLNVSVSDFNCDNFPLDVEALYQTEQTSVFFDRCNFQSSDVFIKEFQSVEIENSFFQNSPSSPLYLRNNMNSFDNCTFEDNVTVNNGEYMPILLLGNTMDAPSQNYFNNITVFDDNLFLTSQVSSNSYAISNSTILCSPSAFYVGNLSDDVSISFYNSLITDFVDDYGQFPDLSAPINLSSEGFNIFTNILAEDFTNNSDLVGIVDFDLMPLDYYGGLTKTMPPNECSPALDAGDPNNSSMSQNSLLPVGIKDIGAAESDLDIIRFDCFNGDCIEVYDASGEFCTLTNCLQECQNGSSISEYIFNVKIYPNPSSSKFNISFYEENKISEIRVTNNLGQEVYSERVRVFGQYDGEIDLSEFPEGIYHLAITTSAGLSSHQLILQQ